MIIEEYDYSLFEQRFRNYERVGEGKDFSFEGLQALYEYLDEVYTEEEPYKLDVISLCCDFCEYENLKHYLSDYPKTPKEIKEITGKEDIKDLNEEELREFKAVIQNELEENTTLIMIGTDLDNGFIIGFY